MRKQAKNKTYFILPSRIPINATIPQPQPLLFMRHIAPLARPVMVYLMDLAWNHGLTARFLQAVVVVCRFYGRLAERDARVWIGEDAREADGAGDEVVHCDEEDEEDGEWSDAEMAHCEVGLLLLHMMVVCMLYCYNQSSANSQAFIFHSENKACFVTLSF